MSGNSGKLVFGVGINDADYVIKVKVDGGYQDCPYYLKWKEMLRRCYSNRVASYHPTYKDCYVCEDWLIFSNFKKWMEKALI